MKKYPTNLSDNRWRFIKKALQLGYRKRKHCMRTIWNAIHYLVKTGCQWRMLPLSFAKWQLVYYYFRKWCDLEHFDLLSSKLREHLRLKRSQKAEASLGIMDSQSVRWGNSRALNSFDGNKKVKGIKRHVIVDKNGLLIAVMITVAHIHDSKAVSLLMRVLKEMLCSIKVIVADGGYRGEIAAHVKKGFGYLIQVMRSDDNKAGFKPVFKRWVIERTFSWFDNDRRLCRNYEVLFESSENMVKLASIKYLLNKI